MKLGVTFPQTEIGTNPDVIRDYAQAAEDLGYNHILVYDHVLGANPASRPDWSGPYTHLSLFHEPFVLLGYLSAFTRRLELVTGVIILPQRQAALVAKQATAVDVLSKGRLRLGIGIGWNQVEYEALGMDFHNRGSYCEEQVTVMRSLWTQDLVTFKGKWHSISDAGLNPLPIQRPIPLWFGGHAEPVLRRAARLGDGWFPLGAPKENIQDMIRRLRSYVREAGKDPNSFGIEARLSISGKTPDLWAEEFKIWEGLGVSHISVNTMNAGLESPKAHIDAIRRFKEIVG